MSEVARCGCVVGEIHRYACAHVGHVDPPPPGRPVERTRGHEEDERE